VITINKTRWISVRLTRVEYNTILRKAKREGLTLSAYGRKRALEGKVTIIDDLTPYTPRLKEIGDKINHGVMLAHQGKIKYIDLTEAKELFTEILETLKKIQNKKENEV
jgi:hypothetical protein